MSGITALMTFGEINASVRHGRSELPCFTSRPIGTVAVLEVLR